MTNQKQNYYKYEKDFINCEKEMNNTEIAFKEKWKKKPKLSYPPENLKWKSLEKLIKDSGWGSEKYKTGDIQKSF